MSFRELIVKSFRSWQEDNASRLAASFSFYAILSLAPLLVFAVAVAGQIYGGDGVAQRKLLHIASDNIGPGSAEFLRTLLTNAHKPGASAIALVLSTLVAIFGASSLFGELTSSISTIWGISPTPGNAIKIFLKGKIVAILMVLVFALLVVGWLVLDSSIGYAARQAGVFSAWPIISLVISTAFLTGVFALTFTHIPHAMTTWRDVWAASIVTAVGFSLAKFLLSLYFTYTHVESAYGPAGALILILLWIYYSAQIFFFGAEMVFVYAHNFGSQKNRVLPGATYS